jgi:hypothetical protein
MSAILRIENTEQFASAKALNLMVVPKRENMLWFIFITANVKNITSYLKTNLLKNC